MMAFTRTPDTSPMPSSSDQDAAHTFTQAFARWTRHDPHRFDRLWFPPKFGRKRIKLQLRRFAPHLTLHLHRSGYDVAVEWNGAGWGMLRSVDLVALRAPNGRWRCDLCIGPTDTFDTLEHLWVDHLFLSLLNWVEDTLMPAELICLARSFAEGSSWANFAARTAPLPAETVYAIACEPPPEGET